MKKEDFLSTPPQLVDLTDFQAQEAQQLQDPQDPQDPPFTNVDVTPNQLPQNETTAAVNFLNPLNIVAGGNDFRTGDSRLGAYHSADGGLTWTNTILPSPGFTAGGDPIAAWGGGSFFLFGGLLFNRDSAGNGIDGTIAVYRSTDNGVTFSGPIILNQGSGTAIFNDKEDVHIDTSMTSPFFGQAYAEYVQFRNNSSQAQMLFQRSLDGGITWSAPIALSATTSPPSVQGAHLATGPDGEVYASWMEILIGTGQALFKVRTSTDGGVTFGPEITVSNVTRTPNPLPVPGWAFRVPNFFAFLAADTSTGPFRGRVYAVWQDNRFGRARILESHSSDRGATWSAPVLVDDSPGGTQNFFPFVSVSNTGNVKVIYYTNRVSPTLLDVFFAESSDGGVSFKPNLRVTTVSSNPNADPSFGQPSLFIGDYIGSAIIPPDDLIAVWEDTRTFYPATGRFSQDIFAAIVPGAGRAGFGY